MESSDSDFMRELMGVFCGEAEERLAIVDARLLAIEDTHDTDQRAALVADLMRELHTLKGSAGAVNLPQVSRLAHALESHFANLHGQQPTAHDIFDRGYAVLDAMRLLIQTAAAGEVVGDDVEQLLATLGPAPASSQAEDPVTWPEADTRSADESHTEGSHAVSDPESPATRAPDPAPLPNVPARGVRAEITDDVVRLSTSKLDSLMARVGELVVTRIGSGRRTIELRTLDEHVTTWERAWRQLRPQVQQLGAAMRGEGSRTLQDLLPEIERLLPVIEQGDDWLQELSHQVAEIRGAVEADERRLAQVTSDIEGEVRRTRMQSVATVFDPLHRIVRDLARDLGKEVVLEAEGGDTEVDRSVIEHIRGPLTHLIRNAIDHGIESPHARENVGKPRRATVRLAATQRGGSLLLAISDDGAGINVAAVRQAALDAGIASSEQLRAMSERDILRLIFRPSLSTSAQVTDLSGRGVGLDVVRDTVERLNGMLDVASDAGVGTTFTLSLPLSVATTQALLIEVADRTYALPIGAVTRITSAHPNDIGRAQGREVITLDDGPVILARLEDVLQLPSEDGQATTKRPVIVLGSEDRRMAVAVDALVGTQDVVVKPLPRPLLRVRHVAGATVLANGEVVVVLNTSDLMRSAMRTAGRVVEPAARANGGHRRPAPGPGGGSEIGTVLVVDDSVVTRMLEKSILEAAGYVVHVAADGEEAMRTLRTCRADVLVSDINMPNMDGLALTRHVRADPLLRALPVVLVTSLDAPDDQVRGMEAGADAYIVKSAFSQDGLLDTVARLLHPQQVASHA